MEFKNPFRKKVVSSPEDVLISQRAAQRIVGDPEILSAFDEIQAAYVKSWAETTPGEAEKRELAYQHFKAVTDVQAVLRRRAQSAQVRDLKAETPNG